MKQSKPNYFDAQSPGGGNSHPLQYCCHKNPMDRECCRDAAAFPAPPSMGVSRQEYWSGVPVPSLSMSSSAEKKYIKMTSNLISIWEVLLMPDYALITWNIKINKTWFFPINSFNLAAHTYINKRHIHIHIYIHIHTYTYQQKNYNTF